MRFLADENVARPIVEGLRAAGLDVESIGETKAGASDSQVVEAARQGGRVLVTEDRDFGEMIVRQKLDLRGVILLELARLSNAAAAARGVRLSRRIWASLTATCWSSSRRESVFVL